jgi:hypothetical protein
MVYYSSKLTSAIYFNRTRRGSWYFEKSKGRKPMRGITNLGFCRDAQEFETHVRFRFRVMYIRRPCQSSKPWPNVQNADDTVPSDEYALILG